MFDRDKKKLETKSASKDNRITPETLQLSAAESAKDLWVKTGHSIKSASLYLFSCDSNTKEVLKLLKEGTPLHEYCSTLSELLLAFNTSLYKIKIGFAAVKAKDSKSSKFNSIIPLTPALLNLTNDLRKATKEGNFGNPPNKAACYLKNSSKITRLCSLLYACMEQLQAQLDMALEEPEAIASKKDEFDRGAQNQFDDQLTLINYEYLPDFNTIMPNSQTEVSESLFILKSLVIRQKNINSYSEEPSNTEAKQDLPPSKPKRDPEAEKLIKSLFSDKLEDDLNFTPLEDIPRPDTPLPTRRAKPIEQQDSPSSALLGASAKPTKPDRTKTTRGYE